MFLLSGYAVTGADVPENEILTGSMLPGDLMNGPSLPDWTRDDEYVITWIQAFNLYERSLGTYAGAYPTFNTADYDDGRGVVCGAVRFHKDAVEVRSVTSETLRFPLNLRDMFRKVNEYAATQPGYAAAFPTFLVRGQLPASGTSLFGFGAPATSHDIILIKDRTAAEALVTHEQVPCQARELGPNYNLPYVLAERESPDQRWVRYQFADTARILNQAFPAWRRAYVEEAFYFAPMLIAQQLQARGWYVEALDWFRTVYDYAQPDPTRRWIYPLGPAAGATTYEHDDLWLRDPLNPHAIAGARSDVYRRFTIMAIVRCRLDYADAEFTRDTAESIPRARTLYETALGQLNTPELIQTLNGCEDVIGELVVPGATEGRDVSVAEGGVARLWGELRTVVDATKLRTALGKVKVVLAGPGPIVERVAAAFAATKAVGGAAEPNTVVDMIRGGDRQRALAEMALTSDLGVDGALRALGDATANQAVDRRGSGRSGVSRRRRGRRRGTDDDNVDLGRVGRLKKFYPSGAVRFCIPPNPVLKGLRLRAALNLYKIRHCRNIAGMVRQLDPYAAPTDTMSGMPTIGGGGQLILPGTTYFRPTPYRFGALLDRAEKLAQMASQMEGAMLSALEKRDAEAYALLKARQDIKLARAGVQLQNLRSKEAEDGVALSELQQDRARIQVKYFQDQLTSYIGSVEEDGLALQATSALVAFGAAAVEFNIPGQQAAGASSLMQGFSTAAAAVATHASYERRRMEWEFQKALAVQDVSIGGEQVTIANDHLRVVGQEGVIAQLQADHAEASADFLANKFTSAELYGWMGDVLGQVYGFFLQQASSMAKLAENQLAFERHEMPPAIVKVDYWTAPADAGQSSADGTQAPDRRGLTGSARLLQDIHQLGQYAFDRNQRKLQLTKTISLAQLAPVEFQQMRDTGVLVLRTPMQLFDRDFPGHYLRLIKRVRVSVVALIPPGQGIRATLSTLGLSRVVIGGDVFQTEVIRRPPESVALSSAINANGIFDLEQQNDLLLPFEGTGVDTTWELRLPRAANPFDFNTLADVQLSIDYTALDSFDYRQQVMQTLPSSVSTDRCFSFHRDLGDAWYDLNNPDLAPAPAMTVKFATERADFPANLDRLRIAHVVLYFARKSGQSFEVAVSGLRFTEAGGAGPVGGAATSIDGVISTRRGNAGSWAGMIGKSPKGEWELSLPDTRETRGLFRQLEDILFVLTFTGRTPEWPI